MLGAHGFDLRKCRGPMVSLFGIAVMVWGICFIFGDLDPEGWLNTIVLQYLSCGSLGPRYWIQLLGVLRHFTRRVE